VTPLVNFGSVFKYTYRLAACVGIAASALALNPQFRISQYEKRNWQVEHGLPRNYVMSVLQAPDGFLAIATEEGLARFDGLRFSPFDLEPALRLSQRWVSTLAGARDGSLWVGTFDGGVYEFKNNRVVNRFELHDSVFALLDDDAGNIWASTRGGVMQLERSHSPLSRFSTVSGLRRPLDTSWNVLSKGPDGSIWVVTADGLFRWRNGTVGHLLTNQSAAGQILSVYADRSGCIRIGSERGLFVLELSSGTARLVREPGVNAPVVSILKDHDGTVWAGTWGKGLWRVYDHRAEMWSAQNGFDDFIRSLYEDHEGDLWIGARSSGLWRWRAGPAVPFGVPEGLAGNFATTVAPGPDGDLWFGTWRGGLYRFHAGSFLNEPTPVPTLYCTIRALAIDRSGHQWIGNWEGLYGFDGRRYKRYFEPDSTCYHVAVVLFDRKGQLWVGTSDHGLFVFPKGVPDTDAPDAVLPGLEVTSLLEDSSGRLWVGTGQGVRALGTPGIAGSPNDRVTSVTEDSKHRIWATTQSGSLEVFAGGTWTVFGRGQGLPEWPLYRMIDDGAGSYWVSSARGILQFAMAQIDDFLAGKRGRLDFSKFDQESGMRTLECHGISQPAGWRDLKGGAWFPTSKGFVHVDAFGPKSLEAPAAHLEQSSVDGKTVEPGAPLQLNANIRAFEIQYTALRFAFPESVQFRYRMEGFDPSWIDAGRSRNARYSRLPPGNYRFLVSARMPGGSWGEPAVLSVRQFPQFHQTGLFWALLVLMALGAGAGVLRWRVLVIKGRHALVLGERNRIAREWHDTLLAGFAAISWQLDEALSRLRETPARAADTIELAMKMVNHYRAEARQVIWDLRENRPETETLADAISSSVDNTARASAGCTVRVSGTAVKLPEKVERSILRICQEAVLNARRHADPKHIEVTLDYLPDKLSVRIQDNGRGFEPAKFAGIATGHFGLAVMQERAQRLGGSLRLTSEPGCGTTVEADIPLEVVHSD
jgi:signal transduction histidine kinase/ligand-binding sensor domain-containing protein